MKWVARLTIFAVTTLCAMFTFAPLALTIGVWGLLGCGAALAAFSWGAIFAVVWAMQVLDD